MAAGQLKRCWARLATPSISWLLSDANVTYAAARRLRSDGAACAVTCARVDLRLATWCTADTYNDSECDDRQERRDDHVNDAPVRPRHRGSAALLRRNEVDRLTRALRDGQTRRNRQDARRTPVSAGIELAPVNRNPQ